MFNIGGFILMKDDFLEFSREEQINFLKNQEMSVKKNFCSKLVDYIEDKLDDMDTQISLSKNPAEILYYKGFKAGYEQMAGMLNEVIINIEFEDPARKTSNS